MKLLIFFALLVGYFQSSLSQNNPTVEELVEGIETLQAQAVDWTYQTDSYSYILDNYSPGAYINDGDYDFIIVGAGTAGSVVTNRLSEITNWKILLIEAGGWENATSDVPDMTDYLRTSDYNWGYKVQPQGDNLKGYINNGFMFPRGKALGGSSVINAMIYARGNPDDFNKWGEDNPGWSYEEVLPYFKKSEKVNFPNASPVYHGTNGTLSVEYSRIYDQVGQAFLEAQNQLGRKVVTDYNGQNPMGFSIVQLNENKGVRDSASKAFLQNIVTRENLRIVPNTLVTKLLIQNNQVYGVQYARNGTLYHATAKKEVILSAGTINTPQLLMLSGIGPKKHLQDLDITLVKDLPVGDNLWDHTIYNYQSFSINYTYVNQDLTTQVEEYLQGKGVLTTADDLQCVGYANLMNTSTTVPDIEHVFHASTPGVRPYEVYKNFFGFTEDSYNSMMNPIFNQSQISIHSMMPHPKSRGTIRLKSASPFDFPLLNPNYFSDPSDGQTLVAALKDQIKIANTPAMQKYNATMIKVCHPSCNCSDYGTDDFYLCMVKTMINSVYHFSGTAKMGPKCNNDSVVDASLRVHGIKSLRVADCSVIPVTTSGHTNPVAYMIGEKAGDLIKRSYCSGSVCT